MRKLKLIIDVIKYKVLSDFEKVVKIKPNYTAMVKYKKDDHVYRIKTFIEFTNSVLIVRDVLLKKSSEERLKQLEKTFGYGSFAPEAYDYQVWGEPNNLGFHELITEGKLVKKSDSKTYKKNIEDFRTSLDNLPDLDH